MAQISQVKLPSGTTYDIKDSISGYTTNTGTITQVKTTAGAHTTINVSSGAATFNVPTKTSHLTNDSGFLTSHQDISGKVDKTGDTMTGNLVVPALRAANTYYGLTYGRTTSTPVETILYTGIKWDSGAHMPVVHITGYAYGLQSPVEFKIGFYIYNGNIGYCGVTNMGSWEPTVYLFKHTVDNKSYVAVGLAGSCYFLQLQADLQDEMGKFTHVNFDSNLWSWSFLTTAGTIPTPDDGVTCIQVPYKANILNPKKVNGHTVNSDVPSNAKFTDTVTTATTTGSGNAVTSITASNGALTVTKGTTFLTSHQDISGKADKATTLAGYGITDAKIASGTITLGSNTITPLTSSSTLSAAKLSGAIPSAVTATTQTAGDNSTKIATTAFVSSAISTLGSVLNYKGTKATVSALPTSGNIIGDVWHVTANSGEYAWDGTEWQELGTAISIPANTGNSTTGISIAAHGTGTVIGVQSSTTTVRGVKTGTNSLVTASHVTGGGNGTAPTLGTAISLIGVQSSTTSVRGVKTGTNSTTTASKVSFGTAFSVPNVTGATDVTVPIRADADVTVPVAASAATTVPIKATSATTVPIKNTSATTVPVVSSNTDATLSFAMDTTDTKKLKISWSATPTRTVFGTSASIYGVQSSTTSVTGVQSSTTSVTGVSGSTTVRGVKTGTSSTTTASKVTLGTALSIPNPSATDVTVPIRADADTTVPIKNTSATSIPNVTSAGTASTWTFENVDVPIRADADTTVPIKNASASTFVTGTTHTVTDNGHTHTI